MDRPNFLFLITDQHRADHVGFGGNDAVRTPNLDSLAGRGMVFDRAYVANPICMPNRSSMMTGRMPSVHGTRFNGISLDWRANTFVRRLRAAGYRTTHIGKSHLQNICVNRERLRQTVDFTLSEEAIIPSLEDGWDELENFKRYRQGDEPRIDDFYGFEKALFTVLHGDQVTGHYENWLKAKGVTPADVQGPNNALARYDGWFQVYQSALPAEYYPSSYVAEKTAEEIRLAAAGDRPFFIHASWPDPHHPFTPPGKYWEMYDPGSLPLPASFYDPHTDSMPHYQRMIARRGEPSDYAVDGWSPTEDQFRHALAAEYGNISLIDDGVGMILRALEESGAAENTIVIFTSDHGDMFGDHGILLKHAMHYEGCIRVPLIIARPGGSPSRTASLASSLDLGQTILELAAVEPYHDMQGVSLAPVLADPSMSVRNYVYIEEDEKGDMTGVGVPTRLRTLVTDEGRLTRYYGHDHGELFAAEDQLEMTNLFSKPTGQVLRQALGEQLLQAILAHADETPRPNYMA